MDTRLKGDTLTGPKCLWWWSPIHVPTKVGYNGEDANPQVKLKNYLFCCWWLFLPLLFIHSRKKDRSNWWSVFHAMQEKGTTNQNNVSQGFEKHTFLLTPVSRVIKPLDWSDRLYSFLYSQGCSISWLRTSVSNHCLAHWSSSKRRSFGELVGCDSSSCLLTL